MSKLILLLCGTLLFSCHTYRPVDMEVFKAYKSHYRTSAELLDFYPDCFQSKKNCDKAATDFSLIGNDSATVRTWDLQGYKTFIQAADTLINPDKYQAVNFSDYMDTLSDRYQVVMINEAHHRPECRIVTANLATMLHQKGFHHLGLEGLHETGAALQERGFPCLSSGFYTREPHYSNLIRVALQLGYNVFPYDRKPGTGKKREINQASEIYAVLQEHPHDKILIHAGWGHIREDTAILGGLMAYEFRKMSGIDPFTINQVRYMPMSEPRFENPFYKRSAPIKAPSILFDPNGSGFYRDQFSEVLLFHPRAGLSYFLENEYLSRKVGLTSTEDAILLVIPASDDLAQLPVPVYTKELKKGYQKVQVYLPFKGTFNLYLLTSKNLLYMKRITV